MEKSIVTPYAKRQYSSNVITFFLFWCALMVVSSAYVTTPLFSVFESTFQVSKTMSAWTSSSFSLFYAIGFLLFGPLADRIGRKPVLLFGLATLAIITPLIGVTSSFIGLVILRGLQGFLASTFAPSALAYAFDVIPSNKLVTTIGFISFGYVTSGIVGQVLADVLFQIGSWNMVFYVFGALYFVTFIAGIILMPTPNMEKHKEGLNFYIYHSKVIFKQQNFILIYAITIMLLLTFMGMYTLLGSYLEGAPFYLNDKEILGFRAIGIIGMLVSPFVGKIVKRIGVLTTLRCGLALSALGLFLLGIGNSIFFLIMMSIVYVFGISIIFPSIMVLVGELGGERRALANAYYAFILFIGAMLGPIIAIELLELTTMFMTFTILALMLVVGFVLSIFLKYQKQLRE
ncbi:MFS transporter [Ornithinibacillus halotolerans]|uniref:MFS transporter n=1 Tax=Ornithinibacillus halotolerans TaxID=1274357 RepID=A0A916S7Q6_9BACI|nr:MFS transporter [Ornithinibacillus halotolerans]GGA84875.1 MFS transporter [Ornithinibacillus halotolerans]